MTRSKAPKIALSLTDYASIDARAARVHYGFASIRRERDLYIMEGKSGTHTLHRDVTSLDRLNAHWVPFAERNAYAS